MPLFLIERTIPNANTLTPEQLSSIAQKSVCAMKHLPGYRWHHSYVTGNKFYCVHEAPNEETIREHSRRGGFPVDRVMEISAVVDPSFADSNAKASAAAA